VGMERRSVPSPEAMGKSRQIDEGRALIGAVRDLWTDEQRLAEERNIAVHVAEANMVAGKESVQSRRESERLRREQEKKRQRTDLAIFRGVLKKATSEDAAIISGQLGQPEGSVPTQDQIDQMALRVLEQREVAQQRREEIEKNRGERPNVSLEKDDRMANEIQLAQEEEVEAGLSVLRALETPGGEYGHTLDDLRKANIEGLRLTKAEKRRNKKVNALTRWLVTRYPDQEDEILETRNQINEERKAKKDGLEPAEDVEISEGARTENATELTEVVEKRFKRKESGDAFLVEIGVGKDEQGNLTIIEGSLSDRRMRAEARYNAINEAYKNAMEKAREDPRLADKALELAIRRHQAMAERGILFNELIARDAVARAEEQAILQQEYAQKKKDALAEQRAQQRSEAVAAAKERADARRKTAWGIVGRFFGRISGLAERGRQQVMERMGEKKEETEADRLRAEIAEAQARLAELTAKLNGVGEIVVEQPPKEADLLADEFPFLFGDDENLDAKPIGQPLNPEQPDGPMVMGAAATPEPQMAQPVVEATQPEAPVTKPSSTTTQSEPKFEDLGPSRYGVKYDPDNFSFNE